MSCFGDLIRSRFLSDALSELQQAYQSTQPEAPMGTYVYTFDKKARESAYNFYLQVYGLKDEMALTALTDTKEILNYVQVDHISFAYSKSKQLIQDMVEYSFNLYGTLPYVQKKHKVAGQTIYTLMSDLRFNITPTTTN